ncbi:MAG: serine hydrolase domain-containing protein [Bacteroidota bacterium]
MKNYALLILSLCLLLAGSCQAIKDDHLDEPLIQKVESSLAPKIVLRGEGIDSALWTLEERMEAYHIPGVSMAFFDDGEIKWAKTYGTFSALDSTKLTAGTLFQAASISKPVAAIGALQLVEAGKIALDAPVNSYLQDWQIPENEFTEDRPVTLRDLLSHTSGLTVGGFDGYPAGNPIPNLMEILDGEGAANSEPIRVVATPGSAFKYSGGGYTVAQKLIEDLTNNSFQVYMQENVLEKVGMNNSGFDQPLPEEDESRAAVGHNGNGELIPGKYNSYPELAAAGLWTTPSDLATFAMSIQKAYQGSTEEILSPELAKKLLTSQVDNWGLGLILIEGDSTNWFSHGGSNFGFRCTMLANIDNGQGAVIMTNGNRGAGLYTEILRSFSKTYGWDIFRSEIRQVISLNEGQLAKFVGLYSHQPDNEFQVSVMIKEGKLQATQLWNDIKIPLLAEAEYEFFEGEEGVSFDFDHDEDGSITSIIIAGGWVLEKIE